MAVAQLNSPTGRTAIQHSQSVSNSPSGFNITNVTYDRDTKACIPGYKIKNASIGRVKPFFSPDRPSGFNRKSTLSKENMAQLNAKLRAAGSPPIQEVRSREGSQESVLSKKSGKDSILRKRNEILTG